jgi:hypothetical protein
VIVFGDRNDGRVIAEEARTTFDAQRDVVIANVVNGRLAGGVIYTGFTKASVIVHFAGLRRNWICRDLVWVSFDYPFNQLSLDKLFGFVKEDNHRSIRLVHHLGFEEVTRIPGRHAGGLGDIVYRMDFERARDWLKIKPRMFQIGVS